MTARQLVSRLPMLTLLIGLACLAGCGGGEPAFPDSGKVNLPAASPVVMPQRAPLLTASPGLAAPAVEGALTSVVLENTGATEQGAAPLTFGQVFARSDLARGYELAGRLADGTEVALQMDVKARHEDGSVRHAIISALAPSLAPGQARALGLVKVAAAPPTMLSGSPAAVLAAGFSSSASIRLDGVEYSASVAPLLHSGKYRSWLAGPIVSEWHAAAPLTAANGTPHPHLTARFAIRSYRGTARARVDVSIENNWAYEPNPRNFTYDAAVTVGGQRVYTKNALTHYHHARWRKVFWWGAAPQVHIRHDTGYLIASRAVPNYDRSVVFPEATLAAMKTGWTGARTEPMGVGLANYYMPSTGGRNDIGLLPGWAATYLLSMDKRAKDVMLGTADLAGSWSAHYRNKLTDRPVSLWEYPYMTVLAHPGDTYNPITKLREVFPACAGPTLCTKVNIHDSAHQPGFAYLPYLVTGDYYYLEELQFWAMWNTFSDNPGYRENRKGLFKPDQVRGQAWSLRTLSQAAYITPDSDPLKSHFHYFMATNLEWYNANYTRSPAANTLGVLAHGYAVVYSGGTGLAPWQDDFFTAAVGHAVELGFDQAKPLLAYKAKFPVSRMVGAGTCWIDGAIYALKVRDTATGALYSTIGQAGAASHNAQFMAVPCGGAEMANLLKLKTGEMTGYSGAVIGYPSNMQPALAYSAGVAGLDGAAAWTRFINRSVRPNYGAGPQFAIIPR